MPRPLRHVKLIRQSGTAEDQSIEYWTGAEWTTRFQDAKLYTQEEADKLKEKLNQ